jgi:hypothetical protein
VPTNLTTHQVLGSLPIQEIVAKVVENRSTRGSHPLLIAEIQRHADSSWHADSRSAVSRAVKASLKYSQLGKNTDQSGWWRPAGREDGRVFGQERKYERRTARDTMDM